MPLEGQMQGIGDAGWAEDFDQAWANRMMRDYGVSMDELRDPNTRRSLNRQQREKQAAAAAPQTGGAELKPSAGSPPPITQSIPGQSGVYGGYNPGGGARPGGIYSQPGGARPGTGGAEPRPNTLPTQPGQYGGINPGAQPGQRPRQPGGNIFQDPGRARTATSAFTLSTNQR